MYWKTPRRLIRRLGLALAVAALAAPAAQAMPVIYQEGGNAPSPRVYADDLHASAPQAPVLIRAYPDDVVRPLASEPVSNVSNRTYPDDMVRFLASEPVSNAATVQAGASDGAARGTSVPAPQLPVPAARPGRVLYGPAYAR